MPSIAFADRLETGETPITRRRFRGVIHAEYDGGQRGGAVGVLHPLRLPDEFRRMVLTILDAAFRHGARSDAHHGEARSMLAVLGHELALKRDRLERREPLAGEPRMIGVGGAGAEDNGMHADVA